MSLPLLITCLQLFSPSSCHSCCDFLLSTYSSVWQVHSLSLCSSIFQTFEFNVAVSTKALSGSLISLNSGWLNINLLSQPISKSLVPGSILRGCAGQQPLPEGFHHVHCCTVGTAHQTQPPKAQLRERWELQHHPFQCLELFLCRAGGGTVLAA